MALLEVCEIHVSMDVWMLLNDFIYWLNLGCFSYDSFCIAKKTCSEYTGDDLKYCSFAPQGMIWL
jgi:hypothetical protein